MTDVNDITQDLKVDQTTFESPAKKSVGVYNAWVKKRMAQYNGNAQMYMTNRVSNAQRQSKTASVASAVSNAKRLGKVLTIADFIPAHPDRILLGQQQQAKGVVLHRPGAIMKGPQFKPILERMGVAETAALPATTLKNYPGAATLFGSDGFFSALNLLVLINTFSAPKSGSDVGSTHFCTGFRGEIVQMIDLADGSIHTRQNQGMGINHKNTIGIEMEGGVEEIVTYPLYVATARVVCYLSRIYGFEISEETIWRHSEVDPKRKTDPGPFFQMEKFLNMCSNMLKSNEIPAAGFYKQGFDPSAELAGSMASIAEAATKTVDPALRAKAAEMYSSLYAEYRGNRQILANRDELAVLSNDHAKRLQVFDLKALTTAERVSRLPQQVTPLNSAAYQSVRYNFETGTWGDGEVS